MKDILDKLFLGKNQTKWFNKGKLQAYREITIIAKKCAEKSSYGSEWIATRRFLKEVDKLLDKYKDERQV